MTSVFITNKRYFGILFYKFFNVDIFVKAYKIMRTLSNVFTFIKLSSSYSHSTNVVNRSVINIIYILIISFYINLNAFRIYKLEILISHLLYYSWTFIIFFDPYLKHTWNKFLLKCVVCRNNFLLRHLWWCNFHLT